MRKYLALLFCFWASALVNISIAQNKEIIHINHLPDQGILLAKGWKFHPGDDLLFSDPRYDDSNWQTVDPSQNIRELPQLTKPGIVWLRLHLSLDSIVLWKSLALMVSQNIASEVYVNGRLVHSFGKLSMDPKRVKAYTAFFEPVYFPVSAGGDQVMAVRCAYQPEIRAFFPFLNFPAPYFRADLLEENFINSYNPRKFLHEIIVTNIFKSGLYFILAFLHLALYFSFPQRRANLFFAAFAFFFFLANLISPIIDFVHRTDTLQYLLLVASPLYSLSSFFTLIALYEAFSLKKKWFFPVMMVWILVVLIFEFSSPERSWSYGSSILSINNLFVYGMMIYFTFLAKKYHVRGGSVIMAGMIYSVVAYALWAFGQHHEARIIDHFLFNSAAVSIPLSISLYLAIEFAAINKGLTRQLKEVNRLSALTLSQEQEKQQILAAQNETLERQVQSRTSELKQSLDNLKTTQAQLIQSEKMASLGELTAGIAHEIQNPLNFVNNFSEVNNELLDELKEEATKGNLQEVKTIADDLKGNNQKIVLHGRRADAIVKGMLQHSRKNTGKKEPTDINALVDEYLRLAYHGLRAKDKDFIATIETHFDESTRKVDVVPQDMGRVLLNLYNNAFYAVNEKKKQLGETYEPIVSVTTKTENDKVEIRVKDNGNGISQKVVDKIFQPFFTTKPTGEGTGLGLSLSYDIIKAHSGELKVETKEGEGSEFMIQLPITNYKNER